MQNASGHRELDAGVTVALTACAVTERASSAARPGLRAERSPADLTADSAGHSPTRTSGCLSQKKKKQSLTYFQ